MPQGRHDGASRSVRLDDWLSVAGRGGWWRGALGRMLHGRTVGLTIHDRRKFWWLPLSRRDDCHSSVAQLAPHGPPSAKARDPCRPSPKRILPQSTIELLPFSALAITAGFAKSFSTGDSRWLCWGTWDRRLGLPSFFRPSSLDWRIYTRARRLLSTLVIGTVFGTGSNRNTIAWYP